MNDVVSTENSHTKSSSTFQLMIYNGLINFFLSVNDNFLRLHSLWIIIVLQIPPKTNMSVNLRLVKDIFSVKNSIKRFDW